MNEMNIEEVVEEASKEVKIKSWLKEIEGNGSIIWNRMEICLRLGRLEEERAMKLMLEEESREIRKEVQRMRIGSRDIGRRKLRL